MCMCIYVYVCVCVNCFTELFTLSQEAERIGENALVIDSLTKVISGERMCVHVICRWLVYMCDVCVNSSILSMCVVLHIRLLQ